MGSKLLEVMVECSLVRWTYLVVECDVLMGVLEYIHIYIRLEIRRIEEMRFYVLCVFAFILLFVHVSLTVFSSLNSELLTFGWVKEPTST